MSMPSSNQKTKEEEAFCHNSKEEPTSFLVVYFYKRERQERYERDTREREKEDNMNEIS